MICFACRRRVLVTAIARARAAPQLPQWQTKAHLGSATAGVSTSDRVDDDYVPSIDGPELEDTRRPGQDPTKQYGRASEPRFSPLQRRRVVRRQGDDSEDNDSLGIFEKVVRQSVEQDDLVADSPSNPAVSLDFYNNLSRLRPMMQTESLETCLEFFFDQIWAKCPFERKPRVLKQRGVYLMRRVIEAKIKDFDNERLPSVAQSTQILHELESLTSEKWGDAVMGLILNIQSRSSAYGDKKAMARKEVLLHDLVDSWIVFHRHCLLPNDSVFRFPSISEKSLEKFVRKRDLMNSMRLVFPQTMGNGSKELPAVAIATYILLSDPRHTNLDIQQKASPLLQPIGKILAAIPVWKPGLQFVFRDYPDVLPYVLRRWDYVIPQLRHTEPSQTNTGTNTERRPGTKNDTSEPVSTRHAGLHSRVIRDQITGALKMGNVEAVEAAWTRFWGTDVKPGDDRVRGLQENQELFCYFIMAFTALHRPRRSVDVWDSMVGINIMPTLQTWTSLMEGCRRSKNPVGIENVWKKLLSTGAELDDTVWSTRIVGLVECGEPEAGLRALDEMLRMSKFQPDSPAVAKLKQKIASVNAAVAALIRLNAMSAAMKVLAWASENGIEPDIITYNTLLRPMVYKGDVQQVDRLLNAMKDQNVQPDAATFTVLLDGLIGSTKDTSPEEQINSLHELFASMEAAGVSANMETFARMMHLLLRDPGANSAAAVDAIRRYMRERGLRLSPYIQTILMDHYFSQDPPDMVAIDALVEESGFKTEEDGRLRLQVLERGGRGHDRVFWERMIKGYATAGEVDKAYGIFEETDNLGSALTLDTLDILLRALVRAGRIDEAGKMVVMVLRHRQRSDVYSNVNDGRVESGEGQRLLGRYWRHRFWGFAVDCGLVSVATLRQLELGITAGVQDLGRAS